MDKSKVFEMIEQTKLVPVVALNDAKDAVDLAKALYRGNLPAAEITFRTAAAEESIRRIANEVPEVLVGAGTIINVDQAKRAVEAGAQFLVSPGVNRKVIEYAQEAGVALLPGVCTPSEIITCLEYGIEVVKFFPAKQYGGLDTIKALAPVFPNLRFMPTGGVNPGNVLDFLSFERIVAVGGSWMVKTDWIDEGKFDLVEQTAKSAMEIVKSL